MLRRLALPAQILYKQTDKTLLAFYGDAMLTHLSIQNFTLVEKLDLDLKPGMTVITGETGAGKSILEIIFAIFVS